MFKPLKDSSIVKCPKCDWKGPLKECPSSHYKSDPESWRQLAGREGYHYFCPRCGELVHMQTIKLS